MLTRLMVLPSTALVRHDIGIRFCRWATMCEDAIYFADLTRRGRFAFVPEPLVRYRKHGAAASGRPGRAVDGWKTRLRWLAEESGLAAAEREHLEQCMARAMVEEIELARWLRQWQRYWKLREFLAGFWRWPDPPAVLSERVYPRPVYFFKDLMDRLLKPRNRV
jgi:hypothetical protein